MQRGSLMQLRLGKLYQFYLYYDTKPLLGTAESEDNRWYILRRRSDNLYKSPSEIGIPVTEEQIIECVDRGKVKLDSFIRISSYPL